MFLLPIALLVLVSFFGVWYIFSYWKRYGLPHLKPEIPFGNLRALLERRQSIGVAISELYRQSAEQLVGVYLFFKPAILVRDAGLAKQIMTSDFASFHDRGTWNNPRSSNVFSLPLRPWKQVRHVLSPCFTPGKLRLMIPTVLDVGKKLEDYLSESAERGEIVELRDICTRYVLDIIALTMLGFDADTLNHPDHPFYTIGRELVRNSFLNNIRTAATFLFPEFYKLTKIPSISPKLSRYLVSLFNEQSDFRERNNVSRKDFFQSLLDLHQEDREHNRKPLSVQQCASNINVFYIAGSETTGGTVIFTLHELTHHPEVMEKLVNEIDETLERSEGLIDYDVIKGMQYLDVCVKETLRKYPGLPILNRKCTQDYQVPNSKVIIRKGTQLIIPLLAYAKDERYFPEPDKYSPERFLEESKNFVDDAYTPFGDGPRQCIATQMGIVIAKITLVMLLSKFRFEATQGPTLEYAVSQVPLGPKHGIKLRIFRRNDNKAEKRG
ncbi:hypothetical protein pipiens_011656 [Culex pipiens pipiens]|uniref:Cytochrome P450 n=1 Tax=Culex pipiens pipiens TaxID=38569 RepID=A0ABD1D5H2_CULPP